MESEKIKRIKAYILSGDTVTIPELQKEFSLSYFEAWQLVQSMVAEKELAYREGITYRVVNPIPQAPISFEEDTLKKHVELDVEELNRNIYGIIETLASFRIHVEYQSATVGVAVTRYDFVLPRNVSVEDVLKRELEITVHLHARDGIRMYQDPKTGFLSVEVPNSYRENVDMLAVVKSKGYLNAPPEALAFAIGQDIDGHAVIGDLKTLRHVLIAESTHSGKAEFLNAMLTSLISKYSPEDLRLLVVDPFGCELSIYNGLPHLVSGNIIVEAKHAVGALNWVITEMEHRYSLFRGKTEAGTPVRNLDDYNRALGASGKKLPRLVIVIDELCRLMDVAEKDIEDRLTKIAQKSCAAGIYLVVATQRPAPSVLKENLTALFHTHIAFRVVQAMDSDLILGETGAEKLIGFGDMLMKTFGTQIPVRIQVGFVPSDKVRAMVQITKECYSSFHDDNLTPFELHVESANESDSMNIQALKLVVNMGKASISMIQRKCEIGYNHAVKIMDWMEKMGYVSSFDSNTRARDVLLTKDEFRKRYGPLD